VTSALSSTDTGGFLDELRNQVRERNFLSGPHPLTRMLLAGELTRPELQEWARQFYLRTQAFSRGIAYMFAKCPDLPTRRQIAENLYEEETGRLSGTAPHVELFAQLARSLGVTDAELAGTEPDDATQGFIDYIDSLAARSFAEVVAAMAIGSETTARDGALRL
jgi:pyrroloquinoline-quinone synthase